MWIDSGLQPLYVHKKKEMWPIELQQLTVYSFKGPTYNRSVVFLFFKFGSALLDGQIAVRYNSRRPTPAWRLTMEFLFIYSLTPGLL